MTASRRAAVAFAGLAFLSADVLSQERALSPATRNSINGRVTDPSGAPMAGVLVTLVIRERRDGADYFHPASVRLRFTTDEQGRYDTGPVTPGEYFVVAIPSNPGRAANGTPNRSGVRITYHPSAVSSAEAKPVIVNVREPQTADITLRAARLAVLGGTVFTSTGMSPNGGHLRVGLGDGLFGVGGIRASLSPDGRFLIGGVAPGTYFLHYSEGPWPPPRDVAIPAISGATVIVRDGDATNIRVMPIRMVRATGRVVIDPALRGQFRPETFTVGASPLNWEGNPGPQRAGQLRDDLTFEFRTWPGQGRVRILPEGAGWTIKAVRHRGADVTRSGIAFRQGDEISELEIELVRGR